MAAVAIDTLRLAKRLKEAGFSEPQAEAMADALKEAREADLSQLASKADLAAVKADLAAVKTELKADLMALRAELKADLMALRAELKADMVALEARLDARMEATKTELLKWVVGLLLGQTAVIAALVKLL